MRETSLNRHRRLSGLTAWLIVLCAFLLEIFLFNGQAFGLIGRKAILRTIAAANFKLSGFTVRSDDPATLLPDASNEHAIELINLNQKVETIWLDIRSQAKPVIRCHIYATDAASGDYYRVSDNYELVRDLDRSQYIRLHLDGASSRIKIVFELTGGQDLTLAAIALNKPIPLDFSLIRFGLLAALGLLAFFIRQSPVCRARRQPGSSSQRVMLVFTATVVVLVGLVFAAAAAGGRMTSLADDNGDIYSRDLTNALASGQLHLLIDPPAALASLANPYDPGLRANSGIKGALWDVAYYQGRYYVYFGIVPALLLFLPFHLLTGQYLPSVWAVILFSAAGLVLLIRLLDRVLFHFFPELPFRFYLLSYAALAAGSNLWWCLSRPKFYEVAISGGLCFGVAGLSLLFRFWQERLTGVTRVFRLTAGCGLLGLAVGARPNLLLLSLLPLPLFWQCLRQPVASAAGSLPSLPERAVRRRALFRNLFAIGVPYLVTGGVLAAYNYLRFGRIAEFGANYQLTVTDMGTRGMSLARLWPGLWYALLNFPVINTAFPFIHFQNDDAFRFSGYYYTDARCTGLLVTLPLCWLLLAWPWLRPVLRQTDRQLRRLMFLLVGVALLLAGVDSMAAGSAGRYLTDFAWLLLTAAILLAAGLVQAATRQKQAILAVGADPLTPPDARPNIMLSVYGLLCGLTILAALLLGLQGENDLFQTNNPILYHLLERLVAFWLP